MFRGPKLNEEGTEGKREGLFSDGAQYSVLVGAVY